jgi:hypothetical protein
MLEEKTRNKLRKIICGKRKRLRIVKRIPIIK